jgi:hypothetical protein
MGHAPHVEWRCPGGCRSGSEDSFGKQMKVKKKGVTSPSVPAAETEVRALGARLLHVVGNFNRPLWSDKFRRFPYEL